MLFSPEKEGVQPIQFSSRKEGVQHMLFSSGERMSIAFAVFIPVSRNLQNQQRTQKRGAPHRQRMGLARPWIKSISEHSLVVVYGWFKGTGSQDFIPPFYGSKDSTQASYEQAKRTFLFSTTCQHYDSVVSNFADTRFREYLRENETFCDTAFACSNGAYIELFYQN